MHPYVWIVPLSTYIYKCLLTSDHCNHRNVNRMMGKFYFIAGVAHIILMVPHVSLQAAARNRCDTTNKTGWKNLQSTLCSACAVTLLHEYSLYVVPQERIIIVKPQQGNNSFTISPFYHFTIHVVPQERRSMVKPNRKNQIGIPEKNLRESPIPRKI